MTDLALEFYPGQPTPMLSPQQWLEDIKMSGTSLAKWFERRSPSRWMKDVMRTTPQELRHTVSTAIDQALWYAAHRQERFSWNGHQRIDGSDAQSFQLVAPAMSVPLLTVGSRDESRIFPCSYPRTRTATATATAEFCPQQFDAS